MGYIRVGYDKNNKELTELVVSKLRDIETGLDAKIEQYELGDLSWREELDNTYTQSDAFILISLGNNPTISHVNHEIGYAHEHNIPIFWLTSSTEFDSRVTIDPANIIDFTSEEQGLHELVTRLYSVVGTTRYKRVYEILRETIDRFPRIKWIYILSEGGLIISGLGGISFGIDDKKSQLTYARQEEDPIASFGVISLSILYRIVEVFALGQAEFSIISGKTATNFVIPIGSGNEYILTMCIEGQPSIDKVVKYFADRDYLAEIEELFN